MATENKMTYVNMGKSGLKVSRLILGCASYGTRGAKGNQAWRIEEPEALEHIKLAYDLGINTFDTANIYQNGSSEIILGRAIKKYNFPRDEIVVMTKAWGIVSREGENLWGKPDEYLWKKRYVNQGGLGRKHLFESIKKSLERLQLDYVDVLQCHRVDPDTPIEETMQALHDIVKAGYARYIGMSSCWGWQFHKMQAYAKQHNLTEFISMQNLYSAIYREEEREMIPILKDLGVGMIPWSPMAQGYLAKPLDETSLRRQVAEQSTLTKVPFLGAVNKRIQEIAQERQISMAQVAIAWCLSKDFMTAPIIGATSVDKLRDVVGAVHVKLTKEEVESIDNLYEPRGISGHS